MDTIQKNIKDFEFYYLVELTRQKIKPLSRWEKPLPERTHRWLRRHGLYVEQIPRKTQSGNSLTETIFSTSENYTNLYQAIILFCNGMILENHNESRFADIRAYIGKISDWMQTAPEPHLMMWDAFIWEKDNWRMMRYTLGLAMVGDAYYGVSIDELHHRHYYYDEFDVALGFPTTDIQKITSIDKRTGKYVRFFSGGAMLLCTDYRDQEFTDIELQQMPGYSGPYYRFSGGQRPSWNNGKLFEKITLKGSTGAGKKPRGDMILLVKEPQVVVSPIIVDNNEHATSPGSKPAKLNGSWIRTGNPDKTENVFCLSYRENKKHYAVAFTDKPESSARFTPNIGVEGRYEVFEWHGDLTGLAEADSVRFEINHQGGTRSFLINQDIAKGQWNSLGSYEFQKGQSSYVQIISVDSGFTQADAVMFVPSFSSVSLPQIQ